MLIKWLKSKLRKRNENIYKNLQLPKLSDYIPSQFLIEEIDEIRGISKWSLDIEGILTFSFTIHPDHESMFQIIVKEDHSTCLLVIDNEYKLELGHHTKMELPELYASISDKNFTNYSKKLKKFLKIRDALKVTYLS